MFLCLVWSLPSYALDINSFRVGAHPDKTRIVLELDRPATFRAFVLDSPWRIVVDMPSFTWKAGTVRRSDEGGITDVRQGQMDADTSRLVIDVDQPVALVTAFVLPAEGGRPDRLVIDYRPVTAAQFAQNKDRVLGTRGAPTTTTATTTAAAPAATSPQRAVSAQVQAGIPIPGTKPQAAASSSTAQSAATASGRTSGAPAPASVPPSERPLIVLDPGHGGIDPGAIGTNGILEKDVTLSMARELKEMLEQTGRYRVRLTRETDVFMRLDQRVAVARRHNAALFISLHADSLDKRNVSGASIYTLSETASDTQTARLAERENKADIIAGKDLTHEDKQVAGILIDLAMRDTMNQSKFLANTIVDTLGDYNISLLVRPHRYAGFAVLRAPDVPSVLFEMGFLSNAQDARNLARRDYRRQIGTALVSGIDAYFDRIERNNRI